MIAFKQFKPLLGIAASPNVGLKHFKTLFSDPEVLRVILNTLEINFLMLLFVTPTSMLLALLINEITKKWLQRTVQTIIYIPHFFTWVVIFSVFYIVFASDGLVNHIVKALGGNNILFFINGNWFRFVLVVSGMWSRVGWGTIVYLAALTQIDQNLFDAAIVDGAGKFRQIVHISLPALLPVFVLMVTIKLGSIMTDGIGQILVFYNPAVYDSADIIGTYVYRIGLGRANFSYATAVGLFESLVGFIMVLISNVLSKKVTGKNVW
ncbi:sugar ABC transporter permease [Treponema parvum]|uniref:Sugar ABC transporter permease n=1 Tax=Treponema parvum TaxID=138851 RepID=A0A975F3F9_9SPIR|nr:ABC transporter permease subunit [Treponema parvum]QTQ13879.1 sugar ABC transporter permease [Treponema parvum]